MADLDGKHFSEVGENDLTVGRYNENFISIANKL